MTDSFLANIGSGPQAVNLDVYRALTDYDLVVPRVSVPVAPGAGQYTERAFQLKVSASFAFIWIGMRAVWSHANFQFQISDPAGRPMQSEPCNGVLALVGEIGRPLGRWMPLAPGADIRGVVRNLDTGTALTFDLALLGFKASPIS